MQNQIVEAEQANNMPVTDFNAEAAVQDEPAYFNPASDNAASDNATVYQDIVMQPDSAQTDSAELAQEENSTPAPSLGVQPYQVGLKSDLHPLPNDNIDFHHAPQVEVAKILIPGYDPSTAPGVEIPHSEHMSFNDTNIHAVGPFPTTTKEMFELTLNTLMTYTNMPPSAFSQLQELWQQTWPSLFQ